MSLTEDDSGWVISGPMELSNMTEVKLAISGEEGGTFLPKNVLGYYNYLRSVAIDHLQVKIPLGEYGDSSRIRFVRRSVILFKNNFEMALKFHILTCKHYL